MISEMNLSTHRLISVGPPDLAVLGEFVVQFPLLAGMEGKFFFCVLKGKFFVHIKVTLHRQQGALLI